MSLNLNIIDPHDFSLQLCLRFSGTEVKEIKFKQQFWHHDVANEDYPWKFIGECLGSNKTTQHIFQEKTTNQKHLKKLSLNNNFGIMMLQMRTPAIYKSLQVNL